MASAMAAHLLLAHLLLAHTHVFIHAAITAFITALFIFTHVAFSAITVRHIRSTGYGIAGLCTCFLFLRKSL
jgi:hypothetical protein